jgi:hypothetical protein
MSTTEATKISTKAAKAAPVAALAPVTPKAEAPKAAPVAAKPKGAPVAAPIAAKPKATEAPKAAPVAASSPIIAQPGSLDLAALKKEAEGMKKEIEGLKAKLVSAEEKIAAKKHPADRVQSATEIMGRTRMAVPADDWRQALHGCAIKMLSFTFDKGGNFVLQGKELLNPGLFNIPALDNPVPTGETQSANIIALNAGYGHVFAVPMGDHNFMGIPCEIEHYQALIAFNVPGFCVDSYVGEDERKLNEETGEYEGEDNRPLMRFVLPVGRYDAAGNYTATTDRENFDAWICLGPTPIAS